ncbi:activating signal cointegrator 1 isoform X3 [Rhodamnia argentea]|uniref:Activating signal cointegrator 1 isoform X3 n=1 Tax=Rhodamnia argentea TaxID=178133 RepID=A0ABM3HKJ9_9MYRT|nr:activating signal cointegrator 1 isoform X3 [Rhodamnia argentea]
MESPGQWLEKALSDLCKRAESGLDLDMDVISGLVSYCDLAQPSDAKEYLDNIIGQEVGKGVIDEYLRQRGYSDPSSGSRGRGSSVSDVSSSKLHAYVKPPSADVSIPGTKRPPRASKEAAGSSSQEKPAVTRTNESKPANQSNSRKKKSGKVVSLAEAAKGSIVFQQGKPCSCQARMHRLVSNCLSCGKIVCEQEGEGPCQFCGALVLKEGSQYAGLDQTMPVLTEAEVAAEAYAKRLVDYDRNSAARTTVIDDQSDYYEIEGNSWLSKEEKELLIKKKEEIEEAERAKRSRVVMTFDLVGRKVLFNEDEVSEMESRSSVLEPPDGREVNRIKPNPTLRIQPIFIDPGLMKKPDKAKVPNKSVESGLCLEITGRVQHERNELKHFIEDGAECSLECN